MKSITTMLLAMRDDPVINKKVMSILNLDSYPRCIVLSNWLEQLRRNNAPQRLIKTLSYLFDDNLAERVFGVINNSKYKKDNHNNK